MTSSAASLDAADPIASCRDLFLPAPGVVAYLDGNSLGRPLRASAERIASFVREEWAGRLIRGWDEGWMDLPLTIGDELGRVALGAAAGQVAFGDSTTVLLYKLVRAAVDARPGRTEIAIDRHDFPTDRYIVEGIAAERGLIVRWIDSGDALSAEHIAAAVGEQTALVVASHVAYRSAAMADAATITRLVHDAGALMLWDLSHSAGSVDVQLDAWGADLAVGCGYKYLGGGPGAPAYAYVRRSLQGSLRQPIQGWIGSHAPFEMGQGYLPAEGMRGMISGTPPVVGLLAMRDVIALIGEVGIGAIRAKSVALTTFAIELADARLPAARLATPRDPALRGSHITLDDDRFPSLVEPLWARGVIPDFRRPNGLRLGLSPLSTSFAEVELGLDAIAEELAAL